MKTHNIIIQNNEFNAISRPTTEEDSFGGIRDRYDLYHRFNIENNGNETTEKVGSLVRYANGGFAVFHGQIRYDFFDRDLTLVSR